MTRTERILTVIAMLNGVQFLLLAYIGDLLRNVTRGKP